jgi:hypothetical protein
MKSIADYIADAEVFLAKPIAEGWYKLPVAERLHLLDHPEAIAKPIQRTFIARREIATEMLRLTSEPEFEQRTVIRIIMQALRMNGWKAFHQRIGYFEHNPVYLGLQLCKKE